MNKIEYLVELIKRDVEMICGKEEDIKSLKLKLIVELKNAEDKCDLYEEMYENDDELIISAYKEYEKVRSPLTRLETESRAYKLCLIDHYEELLREKNDFDEEVSKSLQTAKYNAVKLDELVELIKGVLI